MKRFLEKNVRKRQSNPEQEDKKDPKAAGGEKSPKSESSSSAKAAVAVDNNKAKIKPKPLTDEKFRAQKIFDLFLSNSPGKSPNKIEL